MYELKKENRSMIASLNGRLSVALKPLSQKQRQFVLEYSLDYDKTRALVAAGYSKSNSGTQWDRLKKNPHIRKALDLIEERNASKFAVEREEILMHLYFLATRTADDFYGTDGKLITNINNLSARAKACVDGIEQKEFYDEEGNISRIDTKFKISPKATGLEMAMKHRGLYAPEQTEHKMVMDFSVLSNLGNQPSDDVEERIAAVSKPKNLPSPDIDPVWDEGSPED